MMSHFVSDVRQERVLPAIDRFLDKCRHLVLAELAGVLQDIDHFHLVQVIGIFLDLQDFMINQLAKRSLKVLVAKLARKANIFQRPEPLVVCFLEIPDLSRRARLYLMPTLAMWNSVRFSFEDRQRISLASFEQAHCHQWQIFYQPLSVVKMHQSFL